MARCRYKVRLRMESSMVISESQCKRARTGSMSCYFDIADKLPHVVPGGILPVVSKLGDICRYLETVKLD